MLPVARRFAGYRNKSVQTNNGRVNKWNRGVTALRVIWSSGSFCVA